MDNRDCYLPLTLIIGLLAAGGATAQQVAELSADTLEIEEPFAETAEGSTDSDASAPGTNSGSAENLAELIDSSFGASRLDDMEAAAESRDTAQAPPSGTGETPNGGSNGQGDVDDAADGLIDSAQNAFDRDGFLRDAIDNGLLGQGTDTIKGL